MFTIRRTGQRGVLAWRCATSMLAYTAVHNRAFLRTARLTSIQSRGYSRVAPPSPTRAVMANGTEHHDTPLQTPSINNQTYEPPQRASPRLSVFPSVPPFIHHVARAWFIAILHSDWSNARLAERYDAGIEIKSIRALLRERPQRRTFTI